MLLNMGANALTPPTAAEAFRNHLRETFSSFDTKGIKLSLLQGVVKLLATGRRRRRQIVRALNPDLNGGI
jgi:hypothetical protein